VSVETSAPRRGVMRRTYDWVLGWAESPYATLALFVLAFAESSIFPIPPDVLLLALCLGSPRKSLKYALVCSLGSVLGGIAGYYIGYAFEPVGRWIITTLANPDTFETVARLYQEDAFFYVLVAAFTPIPYKVFTIAGGMFHDWVPLSTLVLASIVGRSARFFLVAGLIWKFGRPIQNFIDRRFNQLMWIFLLLLAGGFAAIKFFGSHELDKGAVI
jgi:membrane protein YqaA with SNARE-associated domain